MARLPYIAEETIEPRELLDAIRVRRRGELLNLDRMLLYSPPYAEGWNQLLGAVRGKLSLPARVHELAICAVAVLTDAEYEYHHHAPEFLKAGGTQAELDALQHLKNEGEGLLIFNASDRSILKLASEMTIFIRVNDTTFDAARQALNNDRQLCELIGVVATYNMVSRYLVTLEIEPEENKN